MLGTQRRRFASFRLLALAFTPVHAGNWLDRTPEASCHPWCHFDDSNCWVAHKRDQCAGCPRCVDLKSGQALEPPADAAPHEALPPQASSAGHEKPAAPAEMARLESELSQARAALQALQVKHDALREAQDACVSRLLQHPPPPSAPSPPPPMLASPPPALQCVCATCTPCSSWEQQVAGRGDGELGPLIAAGVMIGGLAGFLARRIRQDRDKADGGGAWRQPGWGTAGAGLLTVPPE